MSEPGSRELPGTGKGTGTGNEEGNIEIPEEWRSIPIQDYFAKGFKPRIKRKGGREYITLRRGDREKSLGPYSEERWELIMSMYPHRMYEEYRQRMEAETAKEYSEKVPPPSRKRSPVSKLLSVTLSKPPPLSTKITVDTRTLLYYQWAVERGYDGTLGDFLNECVYAYFQEKGIEPVIYVQKREPFNS